MPNGREATLDFRIRHPRVSHVPEILAPFPPPQSDTVTPITVTEKGQR